MTTYTAVRCKFRCNRTGQIQHGNDGKVLYEAELSPVYSNDPDSENRQFWEATPVGSFKVASILQDAFEVGKEYYLDISEAG